ncbi:MAG: hypothetical protein R3E63_04965 [Pseudomonadales bacterium]
MHQTAEKSVIVVQRQTLDWSAMTTDAFREPSAAFCRLWGKPDDYVFQLMQLWDATFSLSYFQTRAALKEIAQKNIAQSDAQFIHFKNYNNIPDKKGFYVFLDDDDWMDPEIAAVLGGQSVDDHAALLWRSMNIGSPQQEHPVFIWGLNGRCMTNNYAVSSVWLNHLKNIDRVVQHAAAEKTLATMGHVMQLDAVLTASNKSPCSSVSLDRGLQGNFSSEKLAQLVHDYLKKMATMTAEHLWMGGWSAPWIAQTIALFERVSASRIR